MPATYSLARQLRHSDGLLPGRDTLRAALILALVAVQSVEVSAFYGMFTATPFWILGLAIPGALFTLAGFALATSARRLAPVVFLRRRMLDLGPSAVFAILVAALVVGPLATELPWRSYFTDSDFWLFLPNALALRDARLPGVFEFNNTPRIVSGNAWMISVTLVGIGMVALSMRDRWRPWVLLGSVVLLLVAALWVALATDGGASGIAPGIPLGALACFVCGAIAAEAPRRVRVSVAMAVAAALVISMLAWFGDFRWLGRAPVALAIAPPVAYLTLYAAMRPLPLARWSRRGWPLLSGLPLLAFPFQQYWIARGSTTQSPLLNLGLAIGPAVVASVIAHVAFRRLLARRFAAATAQGRQVLASPQRRALDWRALWSSRPTLRTLSAQAGVFVPRAVGFALFVVAILAVMALMMLAMQRDVTGI